MSSNGDFSRARPSTERGANKGRGRSDHPLKFYTVAAVAEMLDVSTRTVRRWIAGGELAVHRLGGAVRIADVDLKVFLALHRED
jgi:excisionase family DNA binding protein